MRTIRTKVYKFEELSEQAQQKAIEWYISGNDLSYVWRDIKEDAKQIGLKIISLSDHKENEGEFLLAANEVAANIFNEHGGDCDTYKTAQEFMEKWQPVFNNYMQTEEGEDELMEIENEFLKSLLDDYRIMYNKDIEFQNSDEAVEDTIIANEYEFTVEGNRF